MTFGENQRGWFLEAVHDEESLSKVAKEQNPKKSGERRKTEWKIKHEKKRKKKRERKQ